MAAYLAETGADVTLLEQAQPGHAATRSSFAWLNSNNKTPRAYHDLNYAGMRAWAELARSAGPPGSGASPSADGSPSAGAPLFAGASPSPDGASHADGSGHPAWYRPNGNLEWADSTEGHAELSARVRRLTEWGYPATLVDAAAAAELEPSLRLPPSVTEVAWFPEEGYLLTGPLVAQMAGLAAARGATVLTGAAARVVGIDADGGSVHAVRTATGQVIPADLVVCCAGRWAPQVAALTGSTCPVPLVPWSSPGAEAPGLVVRAGPGSGLARMVHAPEVYLRPHSGGLVHLEAPDVAVDLHTPDAKLRAGAAELLRRARLVIGGLDDAEVARYRVCVRPMPADGQSIVGWLPGANGVYLAVTHSGVTLGAHLAHLITAEVTSGAPAAQLAPYRPARFAPSASRRLSGSPPVARAPRVSGLQGGPHQVEEFVVGDVRRVAGPQLDGSLAGLQRGMAGREVRLAALPPAVDRDAVLPCADVEAAAADLVGRDLIRQHDGGVRVRGEDQPVQPVEHGPVLGSHPVDVRPHRLIHRPIVASFGGLIHRPIVASFGGPGMVRSSWHGRLLSPLSTLCRYRRPGRAEIIAPPPCSPRPVPARPQARLGNPEPGPAG